MAVYSTLHRADRAAQARALESQSNRPGKSVQPVSTLYRADLCILLQKKKLPSPLFLQSSVQLFLAFLTALHIPADLAISEACVVVQCNSTYKVARCAQVCKTTCTYIYLRLSTVLYFLCPDHSTNVHP